MTTRLRVAGAVAGAIGLVLAVGALWISGRFERDMKLAMARVSQGSMLAFTRCGVIEYQEAGSALPYWWSTEAAVDTIRARRSRLR